MGGSILSHEHFQDGHYSFPMERAPMERKIKFARFEDIEAGIVKWPMSVIRINGADRNRVTALADKIFRCWRVYTDKEAFVLAETNGIPHNTITPIARRRGKSYELDLNIITAEHPMGVYHPHAALHHIKKENIMSLALAVTEICLPSGRMPPKRRICWAGKQHIPLMICVAAHGHLPKVHPFEKVVTN